MPAVRSTWGFEDVIDSHAHLYFDRFDEDRDAVFARAREAGVEAFVVIGCDVASSRQAFSLAAERDDVRATAGVHPCDVKNATLEDRPTIEKIVRDLRVHQILEGTNEIMRLITARGLLAD